MKLIKLLAISMLLLATANVRSQTNVHIEKGDKAFDDLDFSEALFFYDVALENNPKDATITRRIANTYRRMGRLNISAEWYRKTLELDASNPQDMLLYAEALKSLQQYDEAIHWYEMYYKLKPNDYRAQSHLRDKFYYKDLFADSVKYALKCFKINNEYPIIGITEFEDEKYLVSAVYLEYSKGKSNIEGLPYLDIYQCEMSKNQELIKPVKLHKNANSKYHDGPATYSFADRTLYITRTNMRNGRPVRDKKGNANLKIYASRFDGEKWSSAQELKINDDGFSNGYPCLTRDGQTMYFVSNRNGGQGGTDIYMSYKNGNNWTEPVNLGPKVNTPGDERFPYISDDGLLYFSSDGHAGLGGLDIFVSEQIGGIWQSPQNMGTPINTNHDDFNLIYNKQNNSGFFCSNRNGNGNDDLFYYQQVEVKNLTIAGTIKSSMPDISFAGERVQITGLNSKKSSTIRLDSFERFEFFGEAGEEYEITMLNDEFFDSVKPVLKYSVKSKLTDPYISVGELIADLKKVPTHKGQLSQLTNKDGLKPSEQLVKAVAANTLVEQISDDANTAKSKADTDLLATNANSSTPLINDDSGLAIAQKENEYKAKLKQADKLFNEGKWADARTAYISANAIKPEETYPLKQIDKVDVQLSNIKKQNDLFDQLIMSGDQALADGKWEEASQAYNTALKIKSGDKYAKSQLTKAENEINKVSKKVTDFDKLEAVIDLKALEIDNVIFDYNKALIRKEDLPTLDKVYQAMKENPNTKLLIRAHCDSRGSLAYNQSLSMSRAMAVQGYLIQRGISSNRIKTEWFGEQRPLNGCTDGVPCEEEQHELNRRAEFKLVKLY